MGDALILLLDRVLHRLHELNGAGTVDRLHACANALRDAVVGALAVEQHTRTLGERGDQRVDIVIGGERHAVGGEVRLDLGAHSLLLHAERGLAALKQQVGEEHRRIENVTAAQVQKPRDLVERGDHKHVRAELVHLFTHLFKLFRARVACELRLELPERLAGERGAIRPHKVDKILVTCKANVLFAHLFSDAAGKVVADRAGIEADEAVFAYVVMQERGDLGNARLAHAHELNAGAGKLLRGLQKVAAVRPQRGRFGQHDERAGGAGEAGEKFARLKVLAHIFRGVEVVGHDNIGVNAALCHFRAQSCEIFDRVHLKTLLTF